MTPHPMQRLASGSLAAASALSLLALLGNASPLQAQTSPAATPPPEEEIVEMSAFNVSATTADRYRAVDAISAVRVRAPLVDTPSSITVLTREMIEDIVPTRIYDVTRFVAGVQDGRGAQFQDRMIMRGFESNGQRTVDNFLQPADADNIDEAVVERIEVAKGPNAILSPSGAPGGSLNIITKSPLYRNKRSLTALLGLYDAQKLSLDVTGPFSAGSPFAYRVVGTLQDATRYWSDDAKLRGKVIAPMFSWRISDKTQLTVKLVGAEHWIFREPLLIIDPSVNASTSDPYLMPGLAKKGLNGIQPWSHVGTHTADLFAQLTSALTQNISLRVAANGRYYFEDSEQNFLSTPSLTNRYNPATGELTQDYTWAKDASGAYVPTYSPYVNLASIPNRGDIQWSRRKTGNLQADVAASYHPGAISTQTVAGFALSRQTGYTHGKTGTMPNIDLTKPFVEVNPVYPSTLNVFNKSSFTNSQLYLSERLGAFKDRAFLTGGILRYDTRTTASNALTTNPASVLDDGKLMSSVGFLVKPLENVSLYYSHSTNSSPTIANNLPLWRDGKQDEFGFKSEFFKQRLSFNGAYFKIDQTNVTIPNPDHQTNPAAPEQLVADYGNHGFELELMGSLSREYSVITTYSHLKMRDSLGRHVRAVADDNAALLLNYHKVDGEWKGLSLYLGMTYTGRRAGDTPVNFTALGVVGKTSFFLKPRYDTTLGASYRWKRIAYRLTIDNPLDNKGYIMIAGGRVSGTGITTAPGTNVKLSTTFEF